MVCSDEPACVNITLVGLTMRTESLAALLFVVVNLGGFAAHRVVSEHEDRRTATSPPPSPSPLPTPPGTVEPFALTTPQSLVVTSEPSVHVESRPRRARPRRHRTRPPRHRTARRGGDARRKRHERPRARTHAIEKDPLQLENNPYR